MTQTSASVLLAPVAEDMRAVDAVIRRRLGSEVVLINQIGEYIISAGGKRLRPVILLLVANALGYKGEHRHELAAVVEFIHTATLLHDDVVDESDLRRGRKTANAVFGNAASVLVGDFLYSRAFQMMVQANSMRIMQILADATNIISEGEVLQLLNMHDPDVTEERYLQVIRYKTAKLFEAAAQIGAVLSGADAATEEAAAEYGRRIGTAFQIVDDVLDFAMDDDQLSTEELLRQMSQARAAVENARKQAQLHVSAALRGSEEWADSYQEQAEAALVASENRKLAAQHFERWGALRTRNTRRRARTVSTSRLCPGLRSMSSRNSVFGGNGTSATAVASA